MFVRTRAFDGFALLREHWLDSFGLAVENSNGGPSRISMLRKEKNVLEKIFAREEYSARKCLRSILQSEFSFVQGGYLCEVVEGTRGGSESIWKVSFTS